jgi:hypothetical protein
MIGGCEIVARIRIGLLRCARPLGRRHDRRVQGLSAEGSLMFAGQMDTLVSLSDLELVQLIYRLVQKIDDDQLADDFYIALTEAFERFAPEIERADLESRHVDDPNRDLELRDALRALERRAMLRLLHRRISEAVEDAG